MNKLIVCNLKMHRDFNEVINYRNKILEKQEILKDVVFCPPVVFMALFSNSNIILGSQDITAYEDLKLTGEIGTCQLSSLNTKYVLIGHYERRNILNENNHMFVNKIKNTIAAGMIPIFCVGETKLGKFNREINKQIKSVFNYLSKDEISKIIIAYEPVYNVNQDILVDVNTILNNVKYIRGYVNKIYNLDNIKVLYGGNVNKSLITTCKTLTILMVI